MQKETVFDCSDSTVTLMKQYLWSSEWLLYHVQMGQPYLIV